MKKEQKKRSDPQPNGAKSSRLELALRAAELGPILPLHWVEDGECSCGIQDCPDAGKHPLTKHGVKDATKDTNQIRTWWHENPKANIGIAMGNDSGIFGVDIDPRHGGDESLHQMQEEYGALPDCPRVRTGGGGEHLYFTVPPGVTVRSRVASSSRASMCVEKAPMSSASGVFTHRAKPTSGRKERLLRSCQSRPALLGC